MSKRDLKYELSTPRPGDHLLEEAWQRSAVEAERLKAELKASAERVSDLEVALQGSGDFCADVVKENIRLRHALEFIAGGCLVPTDGGSPRLEDAIEAAREALARQEDGIAEKDFCRACGGIKNLGPNRGPACRCEQSVQVPEPSYTPTIKKEGSAIKQSVQDNYMKSEAIRNKSYSHEMKSEILGPKHGCEYPQHEREPVTNPAQKNSVTELAQSEPVCKACGGHGTIANGRPATPGETPTIQFCKFCDGSGQRNIPEHHAYGVTCMNCNGIGRVSKPESQDG